MEIEENIISSSSLDKYNEMYQQSITPGEREKFWYQKSKEITWINPPSFEKTLIKENAPFYKWFADATLNVCYNALDRHVKQGNGRVTALISECAYLNKTIKYTYQEMLQKVNEFAFIIKDHHITKGDTVIIYMPMIPESIFAMLACTRLGAIHSVVFGGFASAELSERILDSKPKLIITASAGIEPRKKIPYYPLVNEALQMAHCEDTKVLLVQRYDVFEVSKEEIEKSGTNTVIYQEALLEIPNDVHIKPVEVHSNDPFYILYTSGTSGLPKGIVRDCGGSLVSMNYTMKNIMNINKRDVVFSTGDIGWIVGHVFVVYGPLIRGATTVIMEGKPVGTPNCAKCWEIIHKYKVKAFYTAPTALRAIKREDPNYFTMHQSNLSSLQSIHMAGERCDPDTFTWIQNGLGEKVMINDQWWQTESGYPICSNNIRVHRFQSKPGSALKPQPGFDVRILDDNYIEVPKETFGRICIKLPMPPAFMQTLWNNDEAFLSRYITEDNQYYITGDCGYFDSEGDIFVMSRLDDMIKIAGHRLSTGRMEEVITNIKEVSETAVVSVFDELKGELPFAFMVLTNNVNSKDHMTICNIAKDKIVKEIGAISRLKNAIICNRLPKNKSGKILRKLLKEIINKQQYIIPPTIDCIEVIDEINQLLLKEKII